MPLCKKSDAVNKKGDLKKGYYTRTVKKEGKEDRIMYFSEVTQKKVLRKKKEEPKVTKESKMTPPEIESQLSEPVQGVTDVSP
jgi:hypothetical protein